MCVLDNPPTPCDGKCGHIKFESNFDELFSVVGGLPPLPCDDSAGLSLEELLTTNERLSRKIQHQNKLIDETLSKIQEAINQRK